MKKEILATLAYADIFDYPLKGEEIWFWLPKNSHQKLFRKKGWKRELEDLVREGKIGKNGEFYFLVGKGKIIEKRKSKEKISRDKLKVAKILARLVGFLPGVRFVGLTGAAAVFNAQKGDDIDFLIICEKGKLWTTRFLVTTFLTLLGKRRTPGTRKLKDKICLNIFLDEENMKVPQRDFYVAHEVLQVKPLLDKDNVYGNFLGQNSWVYQLFPNAQKNTDKNTEKHRRVRVNPLLNPHRSVLESVLRVFQLWYMRKRRTIETISDTQVFFHPTDIRGEVLKKFEKKLKKLDISLSQNSY